MANWIAGAIKRPGALHKKPQSTTSVQTDRGKFGVKG